jgi:hypothetical protein
MDRYANEIVEIAKSSAGSARTPAVSDLFFIDERSEDLSNDDKTYFHSMVAKILYLAKRTRPDLLTTVSFLASRVKSPTREDLNKLNRLTRFISRTLEYHIKLSMEPNTLKAYIDASHFVHNLDGTSQSGVYVTLGTGPIHVRSSKQRLVAKSSTEAELYAISDNLPSLLWLRNILLEQLMMENGTKLEIMEDNQSTIALIKRGRPSSETTRHIALRHFFVSDKYNQNEVNLTYVKSEQQLADYFTKPLVGQIYYNILKRIICFE